LSFALLKADAVVISDTMFIVMHKLIL